jgi:hypothetical protein
MWNCTKGLILLTLILTACGSDPMPAPDPVSGIQGPTGATGAACGSNLPEAKIDMVEFCGCIVGLCIDGSLMKAIIFPLHKCRPNCQANCREQGGGE